MKALLFDFDGVILDSRDALIRIFSRICTDYGISRKRIEDFNSFIESDYKKTLEKLGLSETAMLEDCIGIYRKQMLEYLPKLSLYKGVASVIRELSEKHKLAIVSNNYTSIIKGKLSQEGLLDIFSYISGIENGMKPDAAPYLHALDKLGANPQEAAYFGDMDCDMIGARNARIKPIGVGYGYHGASRLSMYTDTIINSPEEMITAVD